MAKKKLLLLTAEKENWAPKELVKYAEDAGFEVEIIDPEECYISLTGEPYVSYNGTKFLGADVCIPRLSEEHLDYKISIINHIDSMGVKIVNKGSALRTASNKIETQIKLNEVGIKTPKTALFTNEEQLEHALESIGGIFPVILKTITGTHGVGVLRADSKPSLLSIVQQMLKTGTEFMIQEYIEHEESARVLLLDGKQLAAVMRTTPKDDFRTNAHQGAELKVHEPSEKELEIVKKAADAIGINFAAVDYILVDDEVILLEVNGSPGFEAMQKTVEVNIADEVIKYCLELSSDDTDEDEKDLELEDKSEGPVEEEEEEEETKEVDLDKEDKEVDVEKESEDEPKEKEVHPNEKYIDAEMFDKEQENIIGTVTSVVISHFNDGAPLEARVDTGANTSSIAGEDIKIDGNSVKFKFNNVIYKFHLLRTVKIKQADSDKVMERPVIRVDITINGIKLHNIEMNVNTREHMKYEVLLGRTALSQAAILINPAAANIDAVKAYVTSQSQDEEE
jgi:ribosomal protein S6--L-glutamate ligase